MDGNGDIQRPFEVLQAVWTKDDKYVIATFANAMRTAEGDGASPSVEFFHSHSGSREGIFGKESLDIIVMRKPLSLSNRILFIQKST